MKRRTALLPLALRFNWAHRSKFLLLTLLVAVGMTVFLLVTELSRVSADGLDDAIAQDVGETGTYVVEMPNDLGLTLPELAQAVDAAVGPFTERPLRIVETLPPVHPECPPYRELGPQQILVLRDATGTPAPLPFGHNLPDESEFCLDGLEIPASALYLPTEGQQRWAGIGIFVDSAYREAALTATTDPVVYRFVLVTGRSTDERAAITEAIQVQLGDAALRHGVIGEYASVFRAEDADSIRSASQGIKIVYSIIGWGVLILGGLGLLVAELIVVRDRTWFFGLARALGARGRHIVALVFADVSLVLLAGTALALLLAAVGQPTVDAFAQSAFGLRVQLIRPDTAPQLLVGGLLLLAVAGTYPALKATRQDPLDVLEPTAR